MSDSHVTAATPADTHDMRAVAETFARALDAGDFGAAADLLSTACECRDGALLARGAEAVLAVYRAAASWAERGFDEVRHYSEIESVSGDRVRAVVTTCLMRVPGRWHRLRHTRDFTLGPSGRVTRIVHDCEPDAATAFRAFVHDVGSAPPPPGFGA
jgi:hypothetical protein